MGTAIQIAAILLLCHTFQAGLDYLQLIKPDMSAVQFGNTQLTVIVALVAHFFPITQVIHRFG